MLWNIHGNSLELSLIYRTLIVGWKRYPKNCDKLKSSEKLTSKKKKYKKYILWLGRRKIAIKSHRSSFILHRNEKNRYVFNAGASQSRKFSRIVADRISVKVVK